MEESLLVSLAAPRLHREGVPIGQVHSDPEDRLYDLLSRSGDLAHARYGAYLRQATWGRPARPSPSMAPPMAMPPDALCPRPVARLIHQTPHET